MQYQLSRQPLLDEMAFSPKMLLCKGTCCPNRSLFLFPTRKDRSHTILKVYAQNIQIKTGATYNYILALSGKSFVNFYNEDDVVIHSSTKSGGRLVLLRFLGAT